MSERELNLRVAESLRRDHRLDEQHFNDGDYVALLDGNVVAIADNPDEAIAALRAIEPNPRRGMVVDVCQQSMDVIR